MVWGLTTAGGQGSSKPTASSFTAIYSTALAFAGLRADGKIAAWGSTLYGGSGEPTDTGFVSVYSTDHAFAALKVRSCDACVHA